MYFKKHASHKLTLAILTATLTSFNSTAQAASPWQCVQVNGEWDCSASDSKIKEKGNLTEQPNDNIPGYNVSLPVARTRETEPTPSIQPTENTTGATQNPTATSDTATQQAPQSPAVITPAPSVESVDIDNLKKLLPDENENIPLAVVPTEQTQEQPSAPAAKTNKSHPLDWYPYANQSLKPGACVGRYVSPVIGDVKNPLPISLQAVEITADQSNSEIGKDTVLRGNVDLVQGGRSLHSPLAYINQESGTINLENGVQYRQTGLLISGDRAEGNINSEETKLFNAEYVLHEKRIRGAAKIINHKNEKNIDIEQGTYTYCPPGENTWQVSAQNISLDLEKGLGRAEHAKLEIFDTPIFYFPVFYFPIDDRRTSGFLYPSFSFSSSNTEIEVPYYFNIAPNLDDTLTARYFSKYGLSLENELRYLNPYSDNRLSLGILPSDKTTKTDRWLLGFNHEGSLGRWQSKIDFTKVSDNEYFNNLGTSLDVDTGDDSHLNQNAQLTYNADSWSSTLLVQKYQTIDNSIKPYQRLPEIRLNGTPNLGIENLDTNYRAVFTRFDRDLTGLTGSDRITGDRIIFNPSASSEVRKTWGYIRPSAKLWHASYNLNNQIAGYDSKPSVSVPILEVDSGLYFDRSFNFQDKSYTQTLEPRLYALYVPYKNQSALPDFDTSELPFTYNSLFRDNRFSGDDRFGDAKQISLGLTTRAISETGREVLSASIGQAFYFGDRKVRIKNTDPALTDKVSDFATSVIWRPNKRVRASFDAAFDSSNFENSEMTLDLKYEEDPNHVIGARHRFTENTRKQTTLSYLWPIAENWSSLGVLQYDWLTSSTIDVATGLEYDSCCWKTRFVLRKELKSNNVNDTVFSVQFVFKGLGGVGSGPDKKLQEKITGYQKREDYNANN